jgi:hypothetical protein
MTLITFVGVTVAARCYHYQSNYDVVVITGRISAFI